MIKFKDLLWFIIFTGCISCSIVYYCFSIPNVYQSESKDRCVIVLYDGTEMNCDDLLDECNRVWVK